jgi:glycine cleavage system aminomethyltransferase T
VLAFLTPTASTAGAASETVLARSPMERCARAAGAAFERRGGWNVAAGLADGVEVERVRLSETVGFADVSWLRKHELRGPHGLALGVAERRESAWWCPVTPDRLLVIGGCEPLAGSLDLTCALAALILAGPLARELLARFCALDVRDAATPVGGFRPGSVARTPGYVLRQGPDRLLILAGWAYGEYLWRVVADAASHLGGGPVGADALDA